VIAAGAVDVKLAPHPVEALGLNALVVLLVSPVSWSHHWVWCVPILLAVWRVRPLAAAVGAFVFLLSPHWWWDSDDGWTALTLTLGNVYVWCAVFVFWSAHRQFRRPRVDVDHRAVA